MSKEFTPKNRAGKPTYLGGSKEPTFLPRIENWNIIPAPGKDAEHFEETLKTFVAFFDDSDEEGSVEMIAPFYFTGKLIMSDERRKDAKEITLDDVVKFEKILRPYSSDLVRIYTGSGKIYYFYFQCWSNDGRQKIEKYSKRMFLYSSSIATRKQTELRGREYKVYRPVLNLIGGKGIDMT